MFDKSSSYAVASLPSSPSSSSIRCSSKFIHCSIDSMKVLPLFSVLALGVSLVSARSPQHVNKKLPNRQPRAPAPASADVHQYQTRKASPSSRYLTEKTKKYVVNGTNIPDVHFDVSCPCQKTCIEKLLLLLCTVWTLPSKANNLVDRRELRWAYSYE
jgi:hypothetical protein